MDLPGIYTLNESGPGDAIDKRITRRYLQSGGADLLINVVDATQLAPQLRLTSRLLEMGMGMVIVLTMVDVADAEGVRVIASSFQKRQAARFFCFVGMTKEVC